MNCCGQKRQSWLTEKNDQHTIQHAEPILENPLKVQYQGTSARMITGVHTGNIYLFEAGEPGLSVDDRDASGILKLPLFALANQGG